MTRRGVPLVFLVATTLGAPWAAESQGPPGAAEAVAATIEVERTLLKEDVERRERLAAERARAAARLTEAYSELDATFKRADLSAASKAIEEVMGRVEQLEGERSDLLAVERVLVERIQDRLRRIRLLEERLALLQETTRDVAGPLAGRWDVALLPLDQRGTFVLHQNGTLVSGTYVLDGGWSGSLQGTLVNRKVYLERIDSRLGRSAEFEGYLSSDGSRIRGSWRSYELSGQEAANGGQWSAVRRSAAP